MIYIIDGHNLIPKLGLSLQSMDDEEELIRRLQEFCRLRRAHVEVYFDGAPPGQAATRSAGSVAVHLVRQGSTADAAIETRLGRLGRQARNWTVVSSDRRVQAAGRAAHAQVLSSEEFALEISRAQVAGVLRTKSEATPDPQEVEEWLEEFDRKRRQD
jgi:predicted RNA-binding protein with PIN domain